MEVLRSRLSGFCTNESKEHGRSFQPRENDCFVSTYPKCGTTWVTFICHCLRSRGDINFGEITEVVPWNRVALDMGQNLNDEHKYSPRIFKTHDTFDALPKGGKIIYVTRNPQKVLISFYEFLLSVVQVDQSEISLDEFFDDHFVHSSASKATSGNIWEHFLSYFNQRRVLGDKLLWLCYEDLAVNTEKCIEKIADFIGIELDDELRQIVLEQSSFKFMKEHNELFDDHALLGSNAVRMGLPEDRAFANKVHKGGEGGRPQLTPRIEARMEALWNETFASTTGVPDYEAMMREIGELHTL